MRGAIGWGIWVWVMALALAVSVRGQEIEPELTKDEIKSYLQRLGSPRFMERERATRDLSELGLEVIPVLKEFAQERDREVSMRALRILTAKALGKNPGVSRAAQRVIENFVAQKDTRMARWAFGSYEQFLEGKEFQSAALLDALGANVRPNTKSVQKGFSYKHIVTYAVTIGHCWKGSLEDFELLTDIRYITDLKIEKIPVGDEIVPCLLMLKKVDAITLRGTEVTAEAYEQLLEQIQGPVRIDWSRGGKLGFSMYGSQLEKGVLIRWVRTGSTADQAGIIATDVIFVLNGEEVDSPEQVKEMERRMAPGDPIKLEIVRDGERLNVEFEAGPDPY